MRRAQSPLHQQAITLSSQSPSTPKPDTNAAVRREVEVSGLLPPPVLFATAVFAGDKAVCPDAGSDGHIVRDVHELVRACEQLAVCARRDGEAWRRIHGRRELVMRRSPTTEAAWILTVGAALFQTLGGCGGQVESQRYKDGGHESDLGGFDGRMDGLSGADSSEDGSSLPDVRPDDGGSADMGPVDSGGDASVCAATTTRCSSGTSVETCGWGGQWGSAWTCATGICSEGACAGSTTSGASCAPGGLGMTNPNATINQAA